MYQLSTVIRDERDLSAKSEVAFHPDGAWYAVTDAGHNEVRLYDTQGCDVLRVYGGAESGLDNPHGLWVTANHLIVCNHYWVEHPPTLAVYRLDSESPAPVFKARLPGRLVGGHSMAMHGDILLVTCTQWEGGSIGGLVSFRFDDETGEISEALDICESPIQKLGRPKGVGFTPDGCQAYMTFIQETVATGWEHIGFNMKKAWHMLREQGPMALYHKLNRRSKNLAGPDPSLQKRNRGF